MDTRGDLIIGNSLGILNQKYEKYELYQSKSSNTGTLSVPKTGGGTVSTSLYTIELDEYAAGADCICLKTSGGYPIDEIATDGLGNMVTVTLGGVGNRDYTLSSVPSAYPVALLFVIKIKLVDSTTIDQDYIVGREEVNPVQTVFGRTGKILAVDGDYSKELITGLKLADTPTFAGLISPTLTGVTTAGGNLTLASSSHGTRGKILFGTSVYDEVNNRFGVGYTTPKVAIQVGNVAGTYANLAVGGSEVGTIGVGGVATARIYMQGTSQADIVFDHTGASADLKMFQFINNNGVLRFRSLLDNGNIKNENILGVTSGGLVGFGNILPAVKCDVTGAIRSTTNIHTTGSGYVYLNEVSVSADAVGDVRMYASGGVFYIQKCTVLNIAKGAGTWVTIFSAT